MKVEMRENGIAFVPESSFEKDALKRLRKEVIERVMFQDDWDFEGKLIVEFSDGWGR